MEKSLKTNCIEEELQRAKAEENLRRAKEEEKRIGGTVAGCPFRTRFHIMPPVGWINDPNGLCQFRGVFHAYFQYSPLSVHGGGGYWGHCTSRDLLHWEYHDPVLTTDIPEDQSGVYSGSALIEDGKMYLFYTGNVKLPGDYDYIDSGRISNQLMVISEDGQEMSQKKKLLGIEDYPEDITAHIRDPKVWKADGRYYMILGARARGYAEDGSRRDKGGVLIYASDDKLKWNLHQKLIPEKAFGYMWECPDLFELDGEKVLSFCPQGLEAEKERFQNIYQSGYSLLSRSSDPEETFTEWDMGFDFYAPQTFRTEDGRRIMIGWAGVPDTEKAHRNLSVANGWQHCLTLPRELSIKDGKIYQKPVKELYALGWKNEQTADSRYHWDGRTVLLEIKEIGGMFQKIRIGQEENGLTVHIEDDLVELSFLTGGAGTAASGRETCECGGGRRRRIGRVSGKVDELTVLADSSIVEVFVNGGELVFTTRIYLEGRERDLAVSGAGKYSIFTV